MKKEGFKVISFDMFDTVITRNLNRPSDLFYLMENEIGYNIKNFGENRIKAEINARKKYNKEEITIDDIYKELEEIYSNEKDEIDFNEIKQIEIKTEIKLCEFNNSFRKKYKELKENAEKIIITTDMYLPKNVIEEILKNNNIEYDKLYVSSNLNLTKRTGNLFKYILNNLNVKPTDVLHIGDNQKSDFLIPKSLGINAIQYKREIINTVADKKYNSYKYKSIQSFINNKMLEHTNNYFYRIGYQTLGPLLYGYSNWLKEKFEKEKFDNIYFLSRDGKIMQKAFNIIDKNIKTKYLYGSRRAFIVPTLWKCNTLKDVTDKMYFSNNISIKAFFRKLGLEDIDILKIITKYNYNLDSIISMNQLSSDKKFCEMYKEINTLIYDNSKNEFHNAINYLKEQGFNGKLAIVDIGWLGNMHNALQNIVNNSDINANIYGYYVGIVPDSKNQDKINMEGFLFMKNKNLELFNKKRFYNALLEFMFSTDEGSTKKYLDNKPVLYQYEYEKLDTKKYLNEIQNGAIDFVSDFYNSNLSDYIKIDAELSMVNINEFGNNPTKVDIDNFKNIMFLDDDFKPIISSKKLSYYIVHPKKFLKDFSSSLWPIGFLKDVLPKRINCYKILIFFSKIRKKIKSQKGNNT